MSEYGVAKVALGCLLLTIDAELVELGFVGQR